MKSLPFAFAGLVFCALPLRAAVVTTADNNSTAADGQTSLLEALTNVTDGETISFNIPGVGPHYIVTPDAGYPLIEKNGVFIDGYSQPGSSANTAGLREHNNAILQIVLDSRTETAGAKRRVIDFPGFGTSESCVLGLMDAHGTRIRGLAFIGVAGMDNSADAYVYNIAMIKECSGSKVQGCWFGLDPGMPNWVPGENGVVAGVYGARSAIASFKWDTFNSAGLVFGNDGDGNGDRGEGNLCVAQRLAVHLQTPAVRVSGNWFNVFPDGTMLNPATQGLALEDGSMEAIENGDGTGMIIGTDGNGTGDADEGNIIGPVVYDTVVEFWGSSPGVVFAGNYVGMGIDGLPAFSLPATHLVSVRKNSSVRIGSDMNGTGDANEGNHIHGLGGSFIGWHNNNNDGESKPAAISVRRNELVNNFGGIPLDTTTAPVAASLLYADVMADPTLPAVTIDPISTVNFLSGRAQPKKESDDVKGPFIDLYIADTYGLAQAPPNPQGRSFLGTWEVDSEWDINPEDGEFTFDLTALHLTQEELGRVTAAATYRQFNVQDVTTPFSATLATVSPSPALEGFNIMSDPAGIKLQWTGGTPPFRIFTATSPAGPWGELATTPSQNFTAPLNGPRRFYRLRDGAPPR
ncbi:MAG TPA: hypothetical protein VG796_23215 [Verrucomicrobiales bacterium]|nr:hypothetical protein [Verrucomicrobiales bacterium]